MRLGLDRGAALIAETSTLRVLEAAFAHAAPTPTVSKGAQDTRSRGRA